MAEGDALINDSRYKVVESPPRNQSNSEYLYLVFSTEAGESNAPLQQIKIEAGVPCTYTDLRNYFESDKKPLYYPLEID